MKEIETDDAITLFENMHTNRLRELALNVILLQDDDVNESLFDYIQFVGEFDLLGEVTALTMKSKIERVK